MPFVLVVQGLTQDQYERSVKEISTTGKIESPSDWPVKVLLAHITGEGANGFRVVDVWESEAAMNEFGEKLGPVLAELGVDTKPEIYPAHTFVSA